MARLLRLRSINREELERVHDNSNAFRHRLYVVEHPEIIQHMIDYMMPLEFEEVDRNMIMSGLVILVTDCNHHVVPYGNPYRKEEIDRIYYNMLGENMKEFQDELVPKNKQYKLLREGDKNDKY